MPSLPPHIHSTAVYTTEIRRAKNRTAASCKVFLLVRVCVVILYNIIHRPHCVYIVCTSVGGAKSLVSLVIFTCVRYMCVVIPHSRQATLQVGGAICWKPSRQRQGHRENLTQQSASLDLGTYYKRLSLDFHREVMFFEGLQTRQWGFCHFFDSSLYWQRPLALS